MLAYGKKKRGSAKLHPHNECAICSEIAIQKNTARKYSWRALLTEALWEFESGTIPASDDHNEETCIICYREFYGRMPENPEDFKYGRQALEVTTLPKPK